jgi:hypothetical protein
MRIGSLANRSQPRQAPAGCWLTEVCRADRLLDREVAIRAVRDDLLTRLEMQRGAIEVDRDDIRLERHQVGDAADLRIGVGIRPCRQTGITDGVIAAEAFIWAEGLEFHGSERGLINVGARHVPARREAGFVEDERPPSVGNDAVIMGDHEVTRGLANVDAVVAVGGMARAELLLMFFRASPKIGSRRTRESLLNAILQRNAALRS